MYGKFFSSTFTGSMYGAGSDVFAVWGYVIANTVDSVVELNPDLLAAILGCSRDRVEAAIATLCAPDPNSRNVSLEGRRLVKEGTFQYRVTNHAIYRALRNEEDRRAYNREKQRESRARRVKPSVIDNSHLSTMSAQAEAEADTSKAKVAPLALPEWLDRETWTAYVQSRKSAARKPAALKAALAGLDKFRQQGHDPNAIVARSLANGWQGLFPPDPAGKKSAPASDRPSIICSDCGQRAFTYTGMRCDPCWRKSQGMT